MNRGLRLAFFVLASAALAAGLAQALGALLPKRHHVTSFAIYHQPPARVWAAVSDLASQPAWRSDLRGARRAADHDGHPVWNENGTLGAWTLEVTLEDPPRRLVTAAADSARGFGGRWTFVVSPDARGTRLTITEDGFVRSPVLRFVTRFVIGLDTTERRFLEDLGRHFGETVTPTEVEGHGT